MKTMVAICAAIWTHFMRNGTRDQGYIDVRILCESILYVVELVTDHVQNFVQFLRHSTEFTVMNSVNVHWVCDRTNLYSKVNNTFWSLSSTFSVLLTLPRQSFIYLCISVCLFSSRIHNQNHRNAGKVLWNFCHVSPFFRFVGGIMLMYHYLFGLCDERKYIKSSN